MHIEVPDPLFKTDVLIDTSSDKINNDGYSVTKYTYVVRVGDTAIFTHEMSDDDDALWGDPLTHVYSADDAPYNGERAFGEWLGKKLNGGEIA